MPCGCFGKKNAKKAVSKEATVGTKGIASSESAPSSLPSDTNGKSEEDPAKTAKRRDVVASYYGDQCALLGYRPTGSRPPSCVDSPSTPSRTPSTAPLAPSPSPPLSSSPTSASSTLRGASCRAELAEKRREFFRDFVPDGDRHALRSYPSEAFSTSTLPAVARAKQFGEVRPIRPLSQPSGVTATPIPPPPGPHLLRPTPPSKMDGIYTEDDYDEGFSSANFLRELREASDEMSRRWGMALEDDPSPEIHADSPLKVSSVTKVASLSSQEERESDTAACRSGPSSPSCTSESEVDDLVGVVDSSQPITSIADSPSGEATGSISSSPALSPQLERTEERELAKEENLVHELPGDSLSSSQVNSTTESSSEAKETLSEPKESTRLLDFDQSPHRGSPEIEIAESESEYNQEDSILIDGERVYIENVDPDSVYMYEETDLQPEMNQAFDTTYDLTSGVATSEELQPILENDSDQESDSEPSLPINPQSQFTQEHSLIVEHQEPGSEDLQQESGQNQQRMDGGLKHKQDLGRLDPLDSDPKSSTSSGNDRRDEAEYDKPAKISKLEGAAETELLLQEEDLALIRQSSSEVD